MHENTNLSCEVTRCQRGPSGAVVGIGGDNWLLEADIAAMDTLMAPNEPGPYFISTPTGHRQWIVAKPNAANSGFTLTTAAGDASMHELEVISQV